MEFIESVIDNLNYWNNTIFKSSISQREWGVFMLKIILQCYHGLVSARAEHEGLKIFDLVECPF